MTGIFMLSMRSVGKKYRIADLEEDTAALEKEQNTLSDRINHIKSSLLAEAAVDSTGTFAARLRVLNKMKLIRSEKMFDAEHEHEEAGFD
ncbi:hypothetical protein SSX86_009089 [Deinandra increscens subsp. villosa]|uniref:Uncharacterized protein n=1 Tax=Deinandra increscens subsp. villosa TaxID=3103831 RepID=A0AAP0D7W7_9ASTR